MSYFDDQEDAWMANDCKGSPDQYNPFDPTQWPQNGTIAFGMSANLMTALNLRISKGQKRRAQRNRARKRREQAA